MDFAALPPEVNSARMYAGPGAGPMLAAAAAWDELATDLQATASSYQSVLSELTGGPWQGPSSASMAAAAAPYVAWMTATAGHAEQTATQAGAAASAYEAAFAMTVPPVVIAANRAALAALIATNLLGQNTPAIATTEADYCEMWAQDAAAMYGYAGNSAAASALTPFSTPPHTTNPAGTTGQAAAVGNATSSAAGAKIHTMATSLSAVPQTLQSLAQPVQSASSASGLAQVALSTETPAVSSGASAPASALTGLGAAGTTALTGASGTLGAGADASSTGLIEDAAGLGLDAFGLAGPEAGGFGLELLGTGVDFAGADALTEPGGPGVFGGLGIAGPMSSPGPLGLFGGLGGGAGASASLGQASSLGALSVPQTWADLANIGSVNPAFQPVALTVPTSSASAAQQALTGTTENAYSDMALAGLAGRTLSGSAGLRRRDRAEAASGERLHPPRKPSSGSVAGITTELRELTVLLRELAELRDSGILTPEEFDEQKRRLLGR